MSTPAKERPWQWPGKLTLLLIVAALAGCVSTVQFSPPAAPPQTTYVREQPDSGSQSAQTTGEMHQHVVLGERAPDQWWTLLASDQIDRLVAQALQNNQSIASASAHLAAARERIRAARGAWYPQVNGTTSAQRTRFGATVLGPLAKDFPPFSAYTAGAQVSYDIDVFGGTRWRVEHATAMAQWETEQLRAIQLSVSGNVVIQALQTASLRAQIRVAEGVVADDDRMLSLVRGAYDAGAVAEMDVLSAQSQADHDRTVLPVLRQQLSVAQDVLASLTGVAPTDWMPLDIDLDALQLPQDVPVSLPSELVHRRPDIGAAESQLRAASAAVGIASADLYPHVTLSAALGGEGLLGGGPSETAWNLLGGITAPLFHGGTLSARRRAAQNDYQAASAAYRQTVLEAFSQVASTLHALENDADELSEQDRALDSANTSLSVTRQAYAAGNAGYIQVLDAQRLHAQAQIGQVQARSQRYIDTVKLLLASGGGIIKSASE